RAVVARREAWPHRLSSGRRAFRARRRARGRGWPLRQARVVAVAAGRRACTREQRGLRLLHQGRRFRLPRCGLRIGRIAISRIIGRRTLTTVARRRRFGCALDATLSYCPGFEAREDWAPPPCPAMVAT